VNSSSPVTDVSGLVQGVYTFELKVTDDKGATATSTVQITVYAAANIAPTANAGADKTITLPINTVSLAGSGADKDGTIASYLWRKTSGPSAFNIVNSSSPVTDVSGLVQGVYTFELKVTDDGGAVGRDTVQIYVNKDVAKNLSPNLNPVANAGNDTTVVSPVDYVILNGSGIDSDGNISAYVWRQLSGPSQGSILSNQEAVTKVGNLKEGTYEFELTVTDNQGAKGKDTVKITVALGRFASESNTLKVYPNPVQDITTLEINVGRPNTDLMIIMSDMSGKIVYKKVFVASLASVKEQIDMTSLGKGTYVITVYFDGMKKQSIKVFKL
jgi:chitodextrinase